MKCPYCFHPCEADEVDNGVGMEKIGPWVCTNEACKAYELDFATEPEMTEKEFSTGFRRGKP